MAPISVKQSMKLPNLRSDPRFFTFSNVSMDSEKYICVRKPSPQNSEMIIDMSNFKNEYHQIYTPMNSQVSATTQDHRQLTQTEPDKYTWASGPPPLNRLVIIDMSMLTQPLERTFAADSALMNPITPILAIKIPGTTLAHLRIIDIEMNVEVKSHRMPEQLVFWKWVGPKMLGMVTHTSVYHWSIEDNSEPVKMFDRTTNLSNNEIIDYKCDPSEKWMVLIGIAPGSPERPHLVKGNMQIYSVDQQQSQAHEAHAASFASFKVPGNEISSILICFATKSSNDGHVTSKLQVIELGSQPGRSSFLKKQTAIFFSPDLADDFPVGIQISHKHELIFVITKLGVLSVHDLETATEVYRTRISPDPIILTCEASSVGGFYAVNSCGQVFLATANESTIVPFISERLNNLELAVNLEKRENLPGEKNLVLQSFDELIAQKKYKEAAELAAESPQGILHTPDTIAKFQSVPEQAGQTSPLLQYIGSLLVKRKLNAFESLELSRIGVNQYEKNLLESWMSADQVECSEELGDLVKTVDNDLASKISTTKVVATHEIKPQSVVDYLAALFQGLGSMKVQVAKEYIQYLGVEACINLFKKFETYEGLYILLRSFLSSSEDPGKHVKNIQAAAKTGQTNELEKFTRESCCYDAVKATSILMKAKHLDAKSLINIYDRFGSVDHLTQYLYNNKRWCEIEYYVQVNPGNAPKVVGMLIDEKCPNKHIEDLILSNFYRIPVEPLAEECEKRNQLPLLIKFLLRHAGNGSQDVHVHNTWMKIITDDEDAEYYLTTNPYYDSSVVGKFCERCDKLELAVAAYRRGKCDDELINVTNKNSLFELQARYVLERMDGDLWGKVLHPENEWRGHLIDEVVSTESKNSGQFTVAVEAFISAGLDHELIDVVGGRVHQNSAAFEPGVDCVTNLLLRLPASQVLRSRMVCKPWLAISSQPNFIANHCKQQYKSPSGLITQAMNPRKFTLIQYDIHPTKIPVKFPVDLDLSKFVIQDSCNGLFLFSIKGIGERTYYVWNPTLGDYIPLPKYHDSDPIVAALIFDPMISHDFKVLHVYSPLFRHLKYQIAIYSSETHLWKSSLLFTLGEDQYILKGVYWNNAYNWAISCVRGILLLDYNMDEEIITERKGPSKSFDRDESGGLGIKVYVSQDRWLLLEIRLTAGNVEIH